MSGSFRVAFYIGNFPIYWYSLTMLTAVLVAFILSLYRTHRRGISLVPIEIAFVILVPVGFIGARLGFVLPHISEYKNFWEVVDLRNGGLSIQGATLTPAVVGLIYFLYWRKKLDIGLTKWMDIILPNLMVAQFIGRWGNFFNQEILGPQLSGFWKDFWHALLPNFIYSHLHLPGESNNIVRAPFFLIEGLFNLLGYFMILYVAPRIYKNWKPGTLTGMYLIWYGVVRASMELERDKQDILYAYGIPTSFAAAIIYIYLGIVMIIVCQFVLEYRKKPTIFWGRPRLSQTYVYTHFKAQKTIANVYFAENTIYQNAILDQDSPIFKKNYLTKIKPREEYYLAHANKIGSDDKKFIKYQKYMKNKWLAFRLNFKNKL